MRAEIKNQGRKILLSMHGSTALEYVRTRLDKLWQRGRSRYFCAPLQRGTVGGFYMPKPAAD